MFYKKEHIYLLAQLSNTADLEEQHIGICLMHRLLSTGEVTDHVLAGESKERGSWEEGLGRRRLG